MKSLVITNLIVISIVFSACVSSLRNLAPIQNSPINVENEQLPPIGVKKIINALTPGKEIGVHCDGIAKMKKKKYYAQGSMGDEWQQRYKEMIIDELSNAGYKTEKKSDIFEMDDSLNARFLVGGILRSETIQSFGPSAGYYTEELVSIEWQVYDGELREVIYMLQTQGYGKVDGVSSEALALAVRNCFRNFLADKDLVQCLKQNVSIE